MHPIIVPIFIVITQAPIQGVAPSHPLKKHYRSTFQLVADVWYKAVWGFQQSLGHKVLALFSFISTKQHRSSREVWKCICKSQTAFYETYHRGLNYKKTLYKENVLAQLIL